MNKTFDEWWSEFWQNNQTAGARFIALSAYNFGVKNEKSTWRGADGEMPKIGQPVILRRNGVVQNEIFTFSSGDLDDYHTGYFWENDNVDDDMTLLPSDRWQPLPEAD